MSLEGQNFVFTGKLSTIGRKRAEKEVIQRGGNCKPYVTKQTTYLVSGLETHEHYKMGTAAAKLKKAKEYIEEGVSISILNEREFLELIKNKQ